MKNITNKLSTAIALVFFLSFFTSCTNYARTMATIGGAIGAGIGQVIDHSTEGTLIGAGVGSGLGYILGNETDKYTPQAAQTQQNVPTPALAPDCNRLYTPEERSACAQGVKDRATNAQKNRTNRAYQYGLGQ